MTKKTKVHKIVILIVDHDGLDASGVRETLENQRYPNYCVNPRVMEIQTAEVDWDDDHPLNNARTDREAFRKLFP